MPDTLMSSIVMDTQFPNKTACWICVARFCLRALGQAVSPLNVLIDEYQRPNAKKEAMSGSGNPLTLIENWQIGPVQPFACETLKLTDTIDRAQVTRIANAIIAGNPVICALKSPGGVLRAMKWQHAVVLCEARFITEDDIIFKFKDPALQGAKANEGRTVTAKRLFGSGFVYKASQVIDGVTHTNLQAYSRKVIPVTRK